MTTTVLALSWGVSRGRETDGYTICRLDDQSTGKRYRCMGGGYDMVGTVFGEWLEDVHQDRLQAISDRAHYDYTKPVDDRVSDSGLYGMVRHRDGKRVTLDGACGLESMQRIAREIGVELIRTYVARGRNRGNTTGWVATWTD